MKKEVNKIIAAGMVLFSVVSVSLLEAHQPATVSSAYGSIRSLNDIFPNLGGDHREQVFTEQGLRNTFLRHEAPLLLPAADSGIDIVGFVRNKNPLQVVEALIVMPYGGRALNKLDIYNAFGRIGAIRSQLTFFYSRDGYAPLFEESTRLYYGRRNRPIPDPPPATALPSSETVYIRLKDTFSITYFLRGNLTTGQHGITYSLTNSATIWFLLFPVMRPERFAAILYVEPIAEGMLVYSVAGIAIPEFIANRTNLAANINRYVTVFMNWLSDGFRSMQ